MLAYAATPVWIPAVIRSQLPAGWQLIETDLAYPGLRSVGINKLHLATQLAGQQVIVKVAAGRLYYSGPVIEIDHLSFDATVSEPGTSHSAFSLQDLKLPVLILPASLPQVSIANLGINLDTDLPGVQFRNLELAASGPVTRTISTEFSVNKLDSVTGQIKASLSPERFEANIEMWGVAEGPMLEASLLQRQQGDRISSELNAEFHLDDGAWPEVVAAVFPDWLRVSPSLSGDVKIKAGFAGSQQLLKELWAYSDGVQLRVGDEEFGAGFDLHAELAEQHISIVTRPPGVTIAYGGDTERLTILLANLIPEFRPLDPGTVAGEQGALLRIRPGSRLEIELIDSPAVRFDGAASMQFTIPGLEIESLVMDDLQIQSANLKNLEIQSLAGQLRLAIVAKTPFSYMLDGATLQADSMKLVSSGQLSIDNDSIRYNTTETLRAEFNNLVLNNPTDDGTISTRFSGFSVSGNLDYLHPDFIFTGQLSGHNADISIPGEPGTEPLVVTAAGIEIDTLLTRKEGSLTTAGSGTISKARISNLGIDADLVQLQWSDLDVENRSGEFLTSTEGFTVLLGDSSYRGVDPKISYHLSSNRDVTGEGALVFAPGQQLPFEFSGNIESRHWQFDLAPVELDAANIKPLLAAVNLPLPGIIEMKQGKVNIQGTVTLDPELHAAISIQGKGIDFSARKSEALNLNLELAGIFEQELTASGDVSLQSANLAAGLVMENISAGVEIDGENNVTIDSIKAAVFRGVLEVSSLQFRAGVLQDSLVQISGTDLGEILTFADIDGLSGSGTLHISLPLSSDEKGLLIHDGSFNSTVPGILKYSAADPATVSGNIGLQALANFHYQELDGNIDYSSDGEYRILVHVAGNNPDLYDGYPIELNLNIGGALPELFEVLFLSGDFEEAILERIRIK